MKCWRCGKEANVLWYTAFHPEGAATLFQDACVECLQAADGKVAHDPACRWCHDFKTYATYSAVEACPCPEGKLAVAWTKAGLRFNAVDVRAYQHGKRMQEDDSINAMKYAVQNTTSGAGPVDKNEFIDKCRKLLGQLGPLPPLKFPTMEQIRENCSLKKEEPKTATFYRYERACLDCGNKLVEGATCLCERDPLTQRVMRENGGRIPTAEESMRKCMLAKEDDAIGIAKLPLRPVRDNSVSILLEDLVAADEE